MLVSFQYLQCRLARKISDLVLLHHKADLINNHIHQLKVLPLIDMHPLKQVVLAPW